MVVVVKRLKLEGFQGHKEWLVNYLGQLHHCNMLKLIGYCLEGENRLLVYEFMHKGSLQNHLFMRGKVILPLTSCLKERAAALAEGRLAPVLCGSGDIQSLNMLINMYGMKAPLPSPFKPPIFLIKKNVIDIFVRYIEAGMCKCFL